MYQKTCIFHLILLGVSSSLVLSVKNKRWFTTRDRLLNGQNLLSVTKVIWRSPKEKIAQTLFGIKIWKEFHSATWSDYKHHTELVFSVICIVFQFNNDLTIIVTERGLNLFDDCAAEFVGRRKYFFFLGESKMYTPGTITNSQTEGAN